MVALQLVGQGAFIVASLVLGIKLLRLWRRTRELPELTLGVSFVLGGGIGYLAWFALGIVLVKGGSLALFHQIALFGLACSCIGSVFNGIGVSYIYRAGARGPLVGVAALGCVMAAGWVTYLRAEPAPGGLSFWVALVSATPIYAWAGVEAFALGRSLHKRAKLGLADPVVVNRVLMWGASAVAVVGMMGLSVASRLIHGPLPPAWVGAGNAGFGLLAALAIWLGFFPPRGLKDRLVRSYAGGEAGAR